MDEQEMDVIERATPIDVDSPEAQPLAGGAQSAHDRERDERQRMWQQRADEVRARAGAFERQVSDAPARILNSVVGALPIQTREHLRTSSREGILAVRSFVEAMSGAALTAVDRIYADPRSAQERAQPRRIVIEREDEPPTVT